ncbi:aminoglycoside phosphotransferase family protein [Shouchella patagoniensis]|uniref:aminoglycoside phosphotransferase family protein n=1 Tax=Shouchella patagoniensis TaxID=228576 RepID=UPI000994E5BE|nr:aminoglycoside phosphotransferase family protein [Shouchella patagoniensis]
MTNDMNEELLAGGNVSDVYRLGDTIRRRLKPESARVHTLLQHLENKGYRYASRFLGIDHKGREILSYIEGVAGHDPFNGYIWSDEALVEIANMLRLYHDAVSDFSYKDDWPPIDNTPTNHEVLCHNDFAIYNIIFNHKKPVGIIDFDVAGPGPRLWDIAYTLYTCAPLSRLVYTENGEKTIYTASDHASHTKHRIQLFFDAYGEEVKEDFVQMVVRRLEGLCQLMTRKAHEGDPAFQKMIYEGHLEHYQKEIQFICKHGKDWF